MTNDNQLKIVIFDLCGTLLNNNKQQININLKHKVNYRSNSL